MSPEQMQPEIGVDGRADLYALGTIAYLMFGGKTPFYRRLMQLVMQKIMHKPAPLSSLRQQTFRGCRTHDNAVAGDRAERSAG